MNGGKYLNRLADVERDAPSRGNDIMKLSRQEQSTRYKWAFRLTVFLV